MFKSRLVGAGSALSFGILLAFSGAPDASAQQKKKMTYEQAFAACKKDVDANVGGTEALTSAARHSRGAACMQKHGFRLKKGTPM